MRALELVAVAAIVAFYVWVGVETWPFLLLTWPFLLLVYAVYSVWREERR